MPQFDNSPAKAQEVASTPSLDKSTNAGVGLKREATVSNLSNRDINFSTGTVEAGSQGAVPVGATVRGSEVGKGQGTYQVTGDMKITENARGQIVVQPAGALKKIN